MTRRKTRSALFNAALSRSPRATRRAHPASLANLAQALLVTLERQVPAGATGNGFDDDGRDVARDVQGRDAVSVTGLRWVACPVAMSGCYRRALPRIY